MDDKKIEFSVPETNVTVKEFEIAKKLLFSRPSLYHDGNRNGLLLITRLQVCETSHIDERRPVVQLAPRRA